MADTSVDPLSLAPPRKPAGIVVPAVLCAAVLFYYGSETRHRNEQWSDPVALWGSAVTGSPNKLRPRINYAVSLKNAKQYEMALREFQNAALLALRPDVTERWKDYTRQLALSNVIDILFETGQFAAAEQVAADLWNEYPGFPSAAILISKFAILRNQPEFALQILDVALDEERKQREAGNLTTIPGQQGIYLNRGAAHQLLGDCIQANKDYAIARRAEGGLKGLPDCIPVERY